MKIKIVLVVDVKIGMPYVKIEEKLKDAFDNSSSLDYVDVIDYEVVEDD